MAQTTAIKTIKQAETEIAVLQVQFKNLDEKFDEIKVDLKDMRDSIRKDSEDMVKMLREQQTEAAAAHEALNKKIGALEKWRWMMMGAGVLLGSLGFQGLKSILTMG